MNDAYLALTLITGSRKWSAVPVIEDALLEAWYDARQDGYSGITVMHGGAPGADLIAGAWARRHQPDGVGHDRRNAAWEHCADTCPPDPNHRKSRDDYSWCPTAGHRRNQQMVDAGPVLCLAFRVGQSTGTGDCIARAQAAGIPVRQYREAS
ncbi:SLOG family protein [Streptomyces sp. NPDC056682]|uniref:SLOG family protein n=1 Tax=Streptomyces sp. NPDC056682 TaxID=3345909 RepID=UPI003682B6D5